MTESGADRRRWQPAERLRGGTRPRAVSCAVVAALLALGAAGCAPTNPPTTSTPPALPDTARDVTVAVVQERIDWGRRVVSLVITSPDDAPVDVTVTSALLSSPAWDDTVPTPPGRTVTLRPGSSRSMFVELGKPRCDPGTGNPSPDGRTGPGGVADLVLETDDGATSPVSVVVTDPQGHLARAWGEDCARRAVAAGLDLVVGTEIVAGELDGVRAATVTLTLEPVPGGPEVQVTAVRGSNLMVPVGDLVVANTWEAPSLRDPGRGGVVELAFTGVRCDAHAIAEDKRGTFLGIETTVDGVAQPTFYLQLPTSAQSELMAWYGDTCGW